MLLTIFYIIIKINFFCVIIYQYYIAIIIDQYYQLKTYILRYFSGTLYAFRVLSI